MVRFPQKNLADSTMNVYDDSKTKIYEDTPSFIKVTGSLSYKWAFRFVDEVMKANGIEKPIVVEPAPEREPQPEETKPGLKLNRSKSRNPSKKRA
jgi:hypothetical protein